MSLCAISNITFYFAIVTTDKNLEILYWEFLPTLHPGSLLTTSMMISDIRQYIVKAGTWRVCVCVCMFACMHAQLHLTLCNSMDCSPPCSSIRDGGLVAKSCPTLVTPCTVACQAPLSMGFSRQGILEWVAISFSRGSSWFRDWTQVSCIAGRFFTDWAMREALKWEYSILFYSFHVWFTAGCS